MRGQRAAALAVLIIGMSIALAWFLRDAPEAPDAASPPVEQAPTPVEVTPATDTDARSVSAPRRIPSVAASEEPGDCSAREFHDALEAATTSDESRERVAALAANLAHSGNTELVLAASILSREESPLDSASRLERALALGPRHPLVLWHAVEFCEQEPDYALCVDPLRLRNTEEILGRNGAYWVQVAAGHYARSDRDAALAAFRRASTEPEFDAYWIENVMLLERAFAASGDEGYSQRVFRAIGHAADMPNPASEFVEICNWPNLDDDWRKVCVDYGQRLAADGDTFMELVSGNAILLNYYERTDNAEQRDEAQARIDELRTILAASSSDEALTVFADERATQRTIDAWSSGGEIAALALSIEEGKRLAADPDFDPCAWVEQMQ